MPKNNSRSFRFSDEVRDILENFNGNSMNDKFENLVLYCFNEVPEVEKKKRTLEKDIEKKRKVLFDISKETYAIENLMTELGKVKKSLEIVSKKAQEIAKNQENLS